MDDDVFVAHTDEVNDNSASMCDALLLHWVSMVIADQPEERAVLSFKRRDSFVDCSLCTMLTHVRNQQG